MHIKKISLPTYQCLRGDLKEPLTYFDESDFGRINELFDCYANADSAFTNISGINFKRNSKKNDTTEFKNAAEMVSFTGLIDKNPCIAGLAHLFLQALKPSTKYEFYPTALDKIIVKQENKIEKFLKKENTQEAFDIRVILAHAKYKANEAAITDWQPGSFAKLADHLVKTQGLGL